MDTQQQSENTIIQALIERITASPTTTLTALALFGTTAAVAKAIYNVWFHPLATYPGPKSYAVSAVYFDWQRYVTGRFLPHLGDLHRQYGPIVRIGPETLSVDGAIAWPQIFAHRPGQPEFSKMPGFFGADRDHGLLMAPRESHRRQRRHVSYAFSDAALLEQQDVVLKYVALVIEKLSEHASQAKPVNVTDWLNFMTFDIIGDLAFGDSFGSLENSNYHPWVRAVIDSLHGFSLVHFGQFHPLFAPVLPFVVGAKFFKQMRTIQEYSDKKAKARIDRGEAPGGRRDFMTYINREKNRDGEVGMTNEEKMLMPELLVTAGSDTTSVALAGLFFYLGQSPNAVRRLQAEVRSAFTSEAEIDFRASARLPYLHACIEEAMRLYPPGVDMPPRLSPGAEVEGKWVPKGTRLIVSQYITHRNPDNFADPDEFHPERWLQPSHPHYDARYKGDNRAAFKPFSTGTRDCIGKNLAYAEMRTFIARVTMRFDWDLLPGQEAWLRDQRVVGAWMKQPLQVNFRHH